LTGGLFKGRIIPTPKGETTDVRPTLSKVREGVFNVLSSYFLNAGDKALNGLFSELSFLDMFAGSGIMSLEALSRGFKNITAVENNPKTYTLVKKTFAAFNKGSADNTGKINLIKGDSLKILSKLENYDVIYIDPPWDFDYEPIILCAFERLAKGGIIIVEYDKKNSKNTRLKNPLNPLNAPVLFKEKTYGRTRLDFYKN